MDDSLIRLDLNENQSMEDEYYSLLDEEVDIDLNRYPSEFGDELRKKLAGYYDVIPENIVLANGSDIILDTLFKTEVPKGGVMAYYTPSYEYIRFFSQRNERKLLEIPLNSDLSLPSRKDFIDEIDALIVCSPNNPTGLQYSKDSILSLLETGVTLILDEAYVEYAPFSLVDMIDEYPNLISVRTFSKAWGLAGIRVGYSISSTEKALSLRDTVMPYNVNSFSLSAACHALDNSGYMERSVERTLEEKDRLYEELSSMGFNCLPSETNFILCRPPSEMPAVELYDELLERGIKVKIFDDPRLVDHVRISIGSRWMNDELIAHLDDIF